MKCKRCGDEIRWMGDDCFGVGRWEHKEDHVAEPAKEKSQTEKDLDLLRWVEKRLMDSPIGEGSKELWTQAASRLLLKLYEDK